MQPSQHPLKHQRQPPEKQQEPPVIAKPVAIDEPTPTNSQVKMLESPRRRKKAPAPIKPEMRPHAFVIMPFGKKKGGDGSLYDFNAIYAAADQACAGDGWL